MYIGIETDNRETLKELNQFIGEHMSNVYVDRFEMRPIGMWIPEDVRSALRERYNDNAKVNKAIKKAGNQDVFVAMVYRKLENRFDAVDGINWHTIHYWIEKIADDLNKE